MSKLLRLAALTLTIGLAACGGDDDGGLDPTFTADHPHIYLPGNRDRLVAALEAGQPSAVRFRDMVDRQLGGADVYDFHAWNAALIGALTGEARYCDYAVAQVDAFVTGEEARIDSGERPEVALDSYLPVGDKIGDVALTYDWCFDQVSADQASRWLTYADQAVWNVWHADEAVWGGNPFPWNSWSTDNPSNNYYYSFLRATLLTGLAAREEIPSAQGFIDFFRTTKIEGELVPTFDEQLAGGGSREGTGYGVAMRSLWELYDLWEGSTGERIADLTPHTRASLVEFLHTIAPTRDRVAPIGDHSRDSSAALFDYHRSYLLGLMRLYPDDTAAAEAAWTLARSTVPEMDQQFMFAYDFLYDPGDIAEAEPSLATAFFSPGPGRISARSDWTEDATWLATVGGPYTEVHAHHDQSAFTLFRGEWLAYDANAASGSGIHAEADVHNLVRFLRDGSTVPMKLNAEAALIALHRGDGYLHTGIDVTPVYSSMDDIGRHQREFVYLEPDIVVIMDRVDGNGADAIWQLNSPIEPTVAGSRATFAGQVASLAVDRILPADATTAVRDWPSLDRDVQDGHRLDVSGGDGIFLHVLSVDGAVTSVAPADAGGRVGVTIQHAGGTATVRFATDGFDATLELGAGEIALGAGVEPIAER